MTHLLTRDGEIKFRGTENECFSKLLKLQSQSTYWAIKNEGWKILRSPIQTLKWRKGTLAVKQGDRTNREVSGYLSPDTELFGIHKEDGGGYVVTHLGSGLSVVRAWHLTVAKQSVIDLLQVNDNWTVIDMSLETKDRAIINKIMNIRNAATFYCPKKGHNVAQYIKERDEE